MEKSASSFKFRANAPEGRKRFPINDPILIFGLIYAFSFFAIAGARAQSQWDGGGGDDNWSTGGNWLSNLSPANDGTVNVASGGTTRLTPNVDVAWNIASLGFNAGSGAFVLSGTTLTLGSGGVINSSGTLQTINNAFTLGAAQTWTATTANLTFGGPVANGGFLLTVNSAAARTISIAGIVSGTGGLQKTGVGGLTLTGSNTFSGGVALTSGTLTANNDSALGSGTLTMSGGVLTSGSARTFSNAVAVTGNTSFTGTSMTFSTGTFALATNATLNVANTVTLAGGLVESGSSRALTKSGNGSLIILNSLATTGAVTVNAGVLALGAGVALPVSLLTFNGGLLATQGPFSRGLGTGAGQVTFTGTGGFAAYSGALTVNGFTGTPVWGVTANFLNNSSVLLLNSTLATDVVTLTNDFSLGALTRTISVADNTALTTDRAVISGVISGTGGLTKIGTGRLELTAANTFAGGTWIQAGEVTVNSLANAGTASSLGAGTGTNAIVRMGNGTSAAILRYTGTGHSSNRGIGLAGSTGGATLIADGSGTALFTGSVTATAAGAKTLTLSGTGTGEIAGGLSNGPGTMAVGKTGTGLWRLSGSNSQSGNTTISAGTLEVGHANAFGTGSLVLAGGTLRGGTGLAIANTLSLTANSAIAGSSALAFGGTFSQTGARTLTINNTALTSFTGPTFVLAENNQARLLTLTGSGNALISSVIQNGTGTGADGLTKSGTGELTLTGSNTYTGATTVSGGLLSLGTNSALGTGAFSITSGTIRPVGGPRTVANSLSLGGNFAVSGTTNLTFSGTATQTGSRTVTVNNTGTTTFSAVNLSNSVTSRTLTVGGTGETVMSGVIANGGGSTAGALSKTGAGRLVLLGTNTYGGATTVSAGTLEIRNGSALGTTGVGTTVAAGATLAVSGGISSGEALSISGTGVGGNGAIRNLSGSNTLTSRVTQTAASSIISDAGVLTVDVASGDAVSGTFALTVGGAGNVAFNDRVNTGAGFTKNGPGSVTVAGTANNLGTTTVNGGRLVLLGSTTAGSITVGAAATLAGTGAVGGFTTINGQHALGSTPGSQAFSAGLAYNAGSTLQWELAANTAAGPGTNFDQVLVTGGNLSVNSSSTASLVFNGAGSTVDWNDPFWATGHSWTMVDFSGAGSSTGAFGTVDLSMDSLGQSLATVRPDGSFSVVQLGGDVMLNYAIVPEPAISQLALMAAVMFFLRRRPRLS